MSMYNKILVPVDGSPTSNAGLQEAIGLAKLTGATLRLAHMFDGRSTLMSISSAGFGGTSNDIFATLAENGKRLLEQNRAEVEASGVAAVETVLLDSFNGRLSEQIVNLAAQWPADLIVLGTHGRRGVGRLLLGSDAEQVLRIAPVPVLLVRGASGAAGASSPVPATRA